VGATKRVRSRRSCWLAAQLWVEIFTMPGSPSWSGIGLGRSNSAAVRTTTPTDSSSAAYSPGPAYLVKLAC